MTSRAGSCQSRIRPLIRCSLTGSSLDFFKGERRHLLEDNEHPRYDATESYVEGEFPVKHPNSIDQGCAPFFARMAWVHPSLGHGQLHGILTGCRVVGPSEQHIQTTVSTTYRLHTYHVPTTYRLLTNHIPTTLPNTYRQLNRLHTDHILPTTYRPLTSHTPITYRPRYWTYADLIPAIYIPNTYRPRYRPYTDYFTDHLPTIYRSHTDHIPTTLLDIYRPHAGHIQTTLPTTLPNTYRPHTDHVPTTLPTIYRLLYRPYTDHIPTTFQPLY